MARPLRIDVLGPWYHVMSLFCPSNIRTCSRLLEFVRFSIPDLRTEGGSDSMTLVSELEGAGSQEGLSERRAYAESEEIAP